MTGEDAPLSSVVSLKLTINSITLTGAKSSPALVSTPITVDFARLVGLRTQLGSAPCRPILTAVQLLFWRVRSSLRLAPSPPTTLNGTFTAPTSTAPQTKSVTVTFPTPIVVAANALAGLHMEFDIPKIAGSRRRGRSHGRDHPGDIRGSGQGDRCRRPSHRTHGYHCRREYGQVRLRCRGRLDLRSPWPSLTALRSTRVSLCPLCRARAHLSRCRARCDGTAASWPAT